MSSIAKRILKRITQYYYYFLGAGGMGYSEPALIVLMYHRILPKSDPSYYLEQPGMIVEPDTFKLHLELLRKHFTITSLNKWINTPAKERAKGISCAITFDDGWADNYRYAFPLLKNTNINATIFLVTKLIDTNKQFWPEKLMRLLDFESRHRNYHLFDQLEWKWLHAMAPGIDLGKVDLNPDQFDIIISKCKSLGEAQIYEFLNIMEGALPTIISGQTDILDWVQIREMKSSNLIDFGSHTQNHTRMNKIKSNIELKNEIAGSKEIIQQYLDTPINTFCYPNGDLTEESEILVKNNYQCAVTTKPGINITSSDPYRIKRIGIHQDVSFDKISFLSRVYKLMRR